MQYRRSLAGGPDNPEPLTAPSSVELIHEFARLFTDGFKVFISDLVEASRENVTPAQLRFLLLLAMRPRITITESARGLAITRASACSAVARLVEHGWVRRNPDPDDARRVHLELTSHGRGLVDDFEAAQAERIESLLAYFTEDEIESFRRLLRRISSRIEEVYD